MFDLNLDSPNVMPSRYRQVTTTSVERLDDDYLIELLTNRNAYRRTRFVVARCGDRQSLIEVARGDDEDALFSDTLGARVVAGPDECAWITDPGLDCGIASHLAAAAARAPTARCVIVEGQYEHISFLLNPDPIFIEVMDIVPPVESKLLDQVRRVIDVAEDLPPISLLPNLIDSRALLAAEEPDCDEVLVPCRGGGVDVDGVRVSYLDERPGRENWTLLGCQRSQQIHRWFYGEEAATQVDFCPRRFLAERTSDHPRITRCCLRESGIESTDSDVLVPWGASLDEVRLGLDRVLATRSAAWTRL